MKTFLISLGVVLFCGWFAAVAIYNIQPLIAGVVGVFCGVPIAVGMQMSGRWWTSVYGYWSRGIMKDYRLSELKEICNANSACRLCPILKFCEHLMAGNGFYGLEIDEVK